MAGKYQSLTIKRKLEILDTLENLPPGKKKKDVVHQQMEYISSDDNLQCSPILTFEEIVNSIRESDVQVTGDDHDDLGEPLRTVSSIKAHSAFLDTLCIKAFLLHAEAADHCYNLLSKLEMELMKASTKCSTYNQTSITDYFETM